MSSRNQWLRTLMSFVNFHLKKIPQHDIKKLELKTVSSLEKISGSNYYTLTEYRFRESILLTIGERISNRDVTKKPL